jgi:hypothetical protein
MNIVFMKFKFGFIEQKLFYKTCICLEISLFQPVDLFSMKHIFIELAEYACTQSILENPYFRL